MIQIRLRIIVRVIIVTAYMLSMVTHYVASFLLIFTSDKTIFSHVFYSIYVKLCPCNLMELKIDTVMPESV